MHLTLRQLKYFVEAAKAGNISRAAEHLHVTSTALSLQIRELEEQFGVELITRHSRGIEITTEGAELHDRAIRILDLVDDAVRALSAKAPPRALRVGAPPSIVRLIGVEAMLAADKRLGGVAVEIVEGWTVELEGRLAAGELDVIIGYELSPADHAVITDIVDDDFVFIAAPALAGGEGPISITEVVKSNLVFFGEQSVSYRGARSASAALGVELASHRHVYSINVWRSLLTRGLATTIGSVASVNEEHRHGEVVIREIEGNPIRCRIGVSVAAGIVGEAWVETFVRLISRLLLDGLKRDRSLPLLNGPARTPAEAKPSSLGGVIAERRTAT